MLFVLRRSVRHPSHDYSGPGCWLVTIVSTAALPLFGTVVDRRVVLNEIGRLVHDCWQEVPVHFPNVSPDRFVVMPNHLHAVVALHDRVCDGREAFGRPVRGSVSTIVRSFKAASTLRARWLSAEHVVLWQRSFHDRRLRDRQALDAAHRYIDANPARWSDRYPDRPGPPRTWSIRVVSAP
jgi:REP element-mobilizing transposase RayT